MKLTNGTLSSFAQIHAPVAAPGAGAASSAQQTGLPADAASVQGTGSLSGSHNTPLHVAGVVLFAGAGLVALRLAGFRFSFDAGFGR